MPPTNHENAGGQEKSVDLASSHGQPVDDQGRLYDEQWDSLFKRLLIYRDTHNGSCVVPNVLKSDPQLGHWVKRQRERYREGALPEHRQRKLNSIGFEWRLRPPSVWPKKDAQWYDNFKKLKAFKQENGHTSGKR